MAERRTHHRHSAQSIAVSLASRLIVKNAVRVWAARPNLHWPFAYVDGLAGMLPQFRSSADIEPVRLEHCAAEWVRAPGVSSERAILYLHGGAFLTCGLNTLQHLLTDQNVSTLLSSVRSLLAPGGRFVFDLFNPMPQYLQPVRKGELVRTIEFGGRSFDLLENTSYDESTRILHVEWLLPVPAGQTSSVARFRMRQYAPSRVQSLLAASGLQVTEAAGDFVGGTLGSASVRQVYCCQ